MPDSADPDWGNELFPDDDLDPDWPDDWPARPWPDPARQPAAIGGESPTAGVSAPRGPRLLGVALTAAVALAAGAGAVYAYEQADRPSTPTSAPGGPPDGGAVQGIALLGRVESVGPTSITVGGGTAQSGTAQSITAEVTSATRFTGSDRSLAQVHVGDAVAVQISESGGVARVLSLQDPVSQA